MLEKMEYFSNILWENETKKSQIFTELFLRPNLYQREMFLYTLLINFLISKMAFKKNTWFLNASWDYNTYGMTFNLKLEFKTGLFKKTIKLLTNGSVC